VSLEIQRCFLYHSRTTCSAGLPYILKPV
jgi:hypothetical protein